jgi:DNA-binding transcriptional LysR family regulator
MIARKLEYLIALSKEGHFARAAAVCNVSQPALSAGIHQLEQELGVQIVKRGQRYQGLTEQGEIVLSWAQKMEKACQRLHQELRDKTGELGGTLRVGVLNTSTPFTSIFTIPFQRHFPEVNLRVMQGHTFEIQQGLEDLTYDVTISFLDESSRRYLLSHPLYRQEYYVLTQKDGPFSGRPSATWDELKKVPLCVFPAETRVFGSAVYQILGTPPPGVPRMETNNMFILLDHVRSGSWISVLPKPVLFMVAGSHEFEAIPLPTTSDADWIGIAVPQREPRAPLAEAFFEIATSEPVLKHFQEFLKPSGVPADLTAHMLPTYLSSLVPEIR